MFESMSSLLVGVLFSSTNRRMSSTCSKTSFTFHRPNVNAYVDSGWERRTICFLPHSFVLTSLTMRSPPSVVYDIFRLACNIIWIIPNLNRRVLLIVDNLLKNLLLFYTYSSKIREESFPMFGNVVLCKKNQLRNNPELFFDTNE